MGRCEELWAALGSSVPGSPCQSDGQRNHLWLVRLQLLQLTVHVFPLRPIIKQQPLAVVPESTGQLKLAPAPLIYGVRNLVPTRGKSYFCMQLAYHPITTHPYHRGTWSPPLLPQHSTHMVRRLEDEGSTSISSNCSTIEHQSSTPQAHGLIS